MQTFLTKTGILLCSSLLITSCVTDRSQIGWSFARTTQGETQGTRACVQKDFWRSAAHLGCAGIINGRGCANVDLWAVVRKQNRTCVRFIWVMWKVPAPAPCVTKQRGMRREVVIMVKESITRPGSVLMETAWINKTGGGLSCVGRREKVSHSRAQNGAADVILDKEFCASCVALEVLTTFLFAAPRARLDVCIRT